jgi:hypothetical protein
MYKMRSKAAAPRDRSAPAPRRGFTSRKVRAKGQRPSQGYGGVKIPFAM